MPNGASTKYKIQIGHASYRGANALCMCRSKAAAVRELHRRGVSRNTARVAVNLACAKLGGYQTTKASSVSDVIEVFNRSDEL